ncbi:MAG: hypothetical protein KAF91_08310, partial [Nostoc sp. TH1S01]|nr:hypothetical protein [Nostoc sp. TH1S01]
SKVQKTLGNQRIYGRVEYMEPINLIIAALAGGIAAGTKDTANKAVKDAYEGLVKLIKSKLAGKSDAEVILARHQQKPEDWEKPLKTELIESGADKDEEIIEAAEKLMELVKPKTENAPGKYNMPVQNAYGSAFGDSSQVNNPKFNINPSEK